MTKKLTRQEAFTELSIQIARLESKIDFLIESLIQKPKQTTVQDVQVIWDRITQPEGAIAGKIPCMFETLPDGYKSKPLGLVCRCPKCSLYSVSGGSIQSSDFGTWVNPATTSLGGLGSVEIIWTMEDGSQLTELMGKHKHE